MQDLLRQGFSPEEAELALQDAGLPGPVPMPTPSQGGYPGPYAPPLFPPAGASPAAAPAVVAAGRTSYLLALLAWIPVPFVGALVAGVAMAAAYPRQRQLSPLAAENARAAANWGLTFALGTLLSVALTIAVGIATTPQGDGGGDGPGWPVVFLVPVLVLGVMHLVITVRGLGRTARGESFRPPAVPFFRDARP